MEEKRLDDYRNCEVYEQYDIDKNENKKDIAYMATYYGGSCFSSNTLDGLKKQIDTMMENLAYKHNIPENDKEKMFDYYIQLVKCSKVDEDDAEEIVYEHCFKEFDYIACELEDVMDYLINNKAVLKRFVVLKSGKVVISVRQ